MSGSKKERESAARPTGWHEGLGRIVHTGKSLMVVRDEAEALADLAAEWDEIPEDEQIDFALEWSDAMSHLATLEELQGTLAKDLTEAQEQQYAEIKRRILELLPTIERLDLDAPREILDG